MSTVMEEAFKKGKKGQEKKDKKLVVVVEDIFAITPLADVDAKAEDLEAAKAKKLQEDFDKAAAAAKVVQFSQQIFPVMAELVERREVARGVSEKNFGLYEVQIRAYLERQPPAGTIARTAYILAAVKEGGISDPEILVKDVESLGLVRQDLNGSISRGNRRFSLVFEPMDEH